MYWVIFQAADSIAELEQHIVHLKVALEKSENERQRQVRVNVLFCPSRFSINTS